MVVRCVLFFGILVALLACAYEPDGKYVNPSIYRPLDNIPATINIDDVEGDYRLAVPAFFRVSIDKAGKSLIYCKVYNEGKEIQTISSYDNYIFLLDPTQLSNGTHEYDIEVKLATGSGSIAESLGVEYYLVQKKLVVSVNNSTPDPVTGLTATMVGGYMTLTWNKPSHEHFQYIITKQNENGNFLEANIISDASTTSFVDKGYVGGKVSYFVSLQSSFFQVSSESVTVELQPIEVLSVVDEGNHLKLKWNVLATFGDDVSIRVSARHFTKDFPYESSESYVDSLYLGDVADIRLKLFRNGFEEQAFLFNSIHSLGSKIKSFSSYSFIESSNKILFFRPTGPSKILRYNATTLMPEDSLYYPADNLIASEDGMRQYLISGSYVYLFNPMNLSEATVPIDLNSIYRQLHSSNLSYPVFFDISNNNLLMVTNQTSVNGQIHATIVTMDLTTKQTWGTEKNGVRSEISGDGNFMVVTDPISEQNAVVYKRGVLDWEEIGKVPFGKMFFSRSPGTRLVRSHNDITQVFDLASTPDANGYFSAVTSAPINATGFDRVGNRIIYEVIDEKLISTISMYSLDDLTLISTHKARVTPDIGDRHFVAGDKQMVTAGYIRNIE